MPAFKMDENLSGTRTMSLVAESVGVTTVQRGISAGHDRPVDERQKHGIAFEEAATTFMDPLALIVDDASHPGRSRIIGESVRRHILVTVFVGDNAFRRVAADGRQRERAA
jgi:uncharacterized DUF497 family protein